MAHISLWLKRLHLKDKSVVGFGLIRRFVGNNNKITPALSLKSFRKFLTWFSCLYDFIFLCCSPDYPGSSMRNTELRKCDSHVC